MKRNLVTVLLLAAVMLLGANDALGQYSWLKDSQNPVLSGGGAGAWDTDVRVPWVILNAEEGRYEMWYTGPAAAGGKIGFAVTYDLMIWEKDPSPVLAPGPGMWDSLLVAAPCVIREDGGYKMWYTGERSQSGGGAIGYATSPDGRNWTKHAGNPVLGPGSSAWEAGSVSHCSVIKGEGGYVMFYTGRVANGSLHRIGRAISVDGITWERDDLANPVLDIGGTGAWDGNVYLPRVLDVSGRYHMWYTAEAVPGDGHSNVGLAVSDDSGRSWTKYVQNPVIPRGTSGSWDEGWVEAGSVMLTGSTFDMWYDGGAPPDNRARVGHASAALGPPAKWQEQDSKFPPDVWAASLSAVNSQVCWAAGGRNGPYAGYSRTTDGGATWVCDSIPGAENGYLAQIVALDADTAYAAVIGASASSSIGVYKTTDGGTMWMKQDVFASLPFGPSCMYFFDSQNGVVIGDPNLEAYTTSNGGVNWNPVSMPAALSNEYTWAGGNSIAGAGNSVWFGTTDRIFRSTDRGHTWTAGSPYLHNSLPSLAFQDSNTGIYGLSWAPTAGLYWRTTDGGVTWNALTDPIIDIVAPTCIRHVPGTTATYLVSSNLIGASRGFACTYNEGESWEQIDNSGTYSIAFPSDSVGWGVRYGMNPIYKYIGPRLLTAVETVGGGITVPGSFMLAQNYPNPFNPSTTIGFALPGRSLVTLAVFNVLGQSIAALVEGEMEAGYHEVKFDASDFASGVYLYRLTAGDHVQTRKLMVLR